MALSLPRCVPPEQLRRLPITHYLSISLSRRSVCAKQRLQGATETQAAAPDQIKIPNTEPCCKNSPLVSVPKKPLRRSSRLRAKKGRQEAQVDPMDMEAAEWVSRILANNAVVEVDPMTIAEQINAEKSARVGNHNPVASLTTSSEVPDYFPPSNGGFPKIPYSVAVAAGSAVVLATIAVLVQALRAPKATAAPILNQMELEGAKLMGDFAGEPVETLNKSPNSGEPPARPLAGGTHSPQLPHRQAKNRHLASEVVVASTAGASAGAAILTTFDLQPGSVRTGPDYSSLPVPPSINSKAGSKGNEATSLDRVEDLAARFPLDSVTPFFPSDRPAESVNQASSPSDEWAKYASVTPFFPSDRAAAFPDEQVTNPATVSQHKAQDQPLRRLEQDGPTSARPSSQFKEHRGVNAPDDSGAMREFVADAVLPELRPELPKMLDFSEEPKTKTPQFAEQNSVGGERVFAAIPEDLLSGPMQSQGEELLAAAANSPQDQHAASLTGTTEERLASNMGDVSAFRAEEAPSMEEEEPISEAQIPSFAQDVEPEPVLPPEELALLAVKKAEDERQTAKFRILQAAFPAVAIGAGAVGALAGVDGAFEMVGLTATASFISFELLWANTRQELLDELTKITDHRKLFKFLKKRQIVKDC